MTLLEKARLGAEVVTTYARVRWLMARLELPAAVASLRSGRGGEAVTASAMPEFNRWRLARAIVSVLRLMPADSRCLMRSLVMLAMLQRRGVASTLVIGVKMDPEFTAHAWIEEAGKALLPSGDGEYRRLTAL